MATPIPTTAAPALKPITMSVTTYNAMPAKYRRVVGGGREYHVVVNGEWRLVKFG